MWKSISAILLFSSAAAAVEVPVDDLAPWTTLEFNNIEANDVSVDEGGLLIRVRSSASPLIYGLDQPLNITGVRVQASWSGELALPDGTVEGEKGADDLVLKFGIVEAGDQTLNWFQRRVAAGWIKRLFQLAPSGSGVSRINFLAATQQPELLGTSRVHPLNDLLHETRVTLLDGPGKFELRQDFAGPVETLGLWISSDGDDTGSEFDLRIDRIELLTE